MGTIRKENVIQQKMRIPSNFERSSSGSKDHLVFRDGSVAHDLKWHANYDAI